MKCKIECDDIQLGKNVKIADDVKISGGKFIIGDYTTIRTGTKLHVTEHFEIGKRSIIGENNIINGRNIVLDREFYTNHNAEIGGGNCFEKTSVLNIGYWFHLGSYSIINTAMNVNIGNEVGIGRFGNIYTHGAYLSSVEGFPVNFGPVKIGNRVWLPNATIHPGVNIGSDVVIGSNSIITKDIPNGSLAIGNPCKVIKENFYPKILSDEDKTTIIKNIFNQWMVDYECVSDLVYSCYNSHFDLKKYTIEGKITSETERVRNILRRNGIRFKVEIDKEFYEPWV